ncbi:XRE family transcriptional regulator [Elizabethkingia meningoseptica]|uniref:XRE family transcriptional regulator n=1 Tax=Elizabethkingia meningoseptica TaxID=238 RepID=UPI0023B1C0D4|nr:XRE family transcriptional regulator [Elizabethkingia meningoseptica]MDE5525661.1 XRE family transcriptional regulator [Elizabethkingia meningoseptica]
MESLANKIRKTIKTPYQIIGEQKGVSAKYVGIIARGERIPVRGKGLEVLKALKQLTQNN